MKSFKDKLSNEVAVGDYIAYAVRSGNSGLLKIGKVLDIIDEETEKPTICTLTLSGFLRNPSKGGKAKLQTLTNIVRIPKESLSQEHVYLLES